MTFMIRTDPAPELAPLAREMAQALTAASLPDQWKDHYEAIALECWGRLEPHMRAMKARTECAGLALAKLEGE